jgi:hypothetical protein
MVKPGNGKNPEKCHLFAPKIPRKMNLSGQKGMDVVNT